MRFDDLISRPEGQEGSFHAVAAEAVLTRLGSSAAVGLCTAEVNARLERFGRNRLPEAARRGRSSASSSSSTIL